MALASMTGFSRVAGRLGVWQWTWELKSVNARGLDVRLRMPQGFEALESEVRERVAKRIDRGACQVNLAATRVGAAPVVRVDRAALDRVIAAIADIPLFDRLRPASLDGLLALRGIVETIEPEDTPEERAALHAAVLADLATALDALVAARRAEGNALERVLSDRVTRIAALTTAADNTPGRKPEAIQARLERQIAALGQSHGLDSTRLYQEAILLAARSDIREELDRLAAHAASAADLLAKGGIVGRRLDFLSQELGRESNTLCSKSNDAALTAIGLDLKVEVEQLREQVQNIE
jgi:uncharacterized protein (TIGR00255 family)